MFADDYDFSALQGLRDTKGNIYFEISGYDIFFGSQKGKLNDSKTLDKLRKQYKIKNIQAEYSDPKLALPHQIIETEQALDKNPALKNNQVFYLFAQSGSEIKYVLFQTLNQRDILLEKAFINAFLNDELSYYISDDWTGETISFVGRIVQLGTACRWRSPHNLSCRGGQISWSEFSSAESAEFDLDTRIAANSEGPYTILSQDNIDILFEDVPTTAYRVVYMNEKAHYTLIVYYVAQEIRNRFVSCTMSNYGYNRNDYELSPLLQQFMSIPSPPDWANNQFDVPQYEQSEFLHPLWSPNIELRLGSVFPLGDFNRIFQFAPSFDLFICFPIKQKMSIDAGLMMSFPIKSSLFDFTYQGETLETKMKSLVGVSLRYGYQHTLSKNLSCKTYMGIGFSSLFTDLVKEIDDNDNKIYHSVGALDLYGGIQLNYKQLGYFIECHRTTLSNSSKVVNNFGNSFLHTGFTYYFNTNEKF
jgi:hypothetical protein